MEMKLGNQINACRKRLGLTQEELAKRLGVTNQAVSKWETGQSCPDIELLPVLAELFGISLDELFGRETERLVTDLPWPDNNDLHAVVFVGHRLREHGPLDRDGVELHFSGTVRDIDSAFSVTCKDSRIEGSVNAGDSVICGDVGGSVSAGDGVTCGDVGGSVNAGDGITCGSIGGNATAADEIRCTTIGGKAEASDVIRICSESETD